MNTPPLWLTFIFIFVFQSTCVYASPKHVIGWIETITVSQKRIQMNAKIDTGADVTSINANILKTFTLNGDDWINFEIINKLGQHFSLQRKVVRYVKIKRKQASSVRRPVVELELCLGKVHRKIEVNFSVRTNFDYQVLIGRNFLSGFFIVDVEKEYTTQVDCHVNELR